MEHHWFGWTNVVAYIDGPDKGETESGFRRRIIWELLALDEACR